MSNARWIVLEEFLVREELAALIAHVQRNQLGFAPSGVVAGADPTYRGHRRSQVLLDVGPARAVIGARIERYFPYICAALDHPRFAIARVEAQVTSSNDGDYFRVHDDNSRGCAPTRALTFVYFFHREPRPFEGGELVLHDARGIHPITPEQNQIVFFPSGCLHEIAPVRCASRAFADSRFTVNGWIHRAP
jgi:SM-20-related protein